MNSKLLALAAMVGMACSASFSYNQCDTTNGPSKWSGDCQTANKGTPVNLCGATAMTAPTLVLSTSYATSRTVKVKNNGYTIQADMVSNMPTLQAGDLANKVGYTTNTTTQTWILEQVHFHWGRTALTNEGSEHYMQGTAYPIEAHYVHYNSRYASVTAAAGSGNTDALLVVGVFLQIGSTDVNLMTQLASKSTDYTTTSTEQSYSVSMTDLFDGTGNFYSYPGGLTTPGCNLIVTWIVMSTPKTITLATLNKFKAVSTTPPGTTAPLISLYGNFRPLQGIGSRTIYYSSGSTAACTTPTAPDFKCTSGAFAGQPNLMYSLGLSLVGLLALWR